MLDLDTFLLVTTGLAAMVNLMGLCFVGYKFLRSKRWLVHEIERLSKNQIELRKEITRVRKRATLNEVGKDLRLPAKMPSQLGEDALIYDFFKGKKNGFFVEVGAYDGVGFSNTYFLEALGWDGILVEPSPELSVACRKARPNSQVVQAACGNGSGAVTFKAAKGANAVGTLSFIGDNEWHRARIAREGGVIEEIIVPLITLAKILEGECRRVDVLSIDVEGAELEVLKGADVERLEPTVIIVEDNTNGRDSRVDDFIISRGYRRDLTLAHNVFYVRSNDPRSFVQA